MPQDLLDIAEPMVSDKQRYAAELAQGQDITCIDPCELLCVLEDHED